MTAVRLQYTSTTHLAEDAAQIAAAEEDGPRAVPALKQSSRAHAPIGGGGGGGGAQQALVVGEPRPMRHARHSMHPTAVHKPGRRRPVLRHATSAGSSKTHTLPASGVRCRPGSMCPLPSLAAPHLQDRLLPKVGGHRGHPGVAPHSADARGVVCSRRSTTGASARGRAGVGRGGPPLARGGEGGGAARQRALPQQQSYTVYIYAHIYTVLWQSGGVIRPATQGLSSILFPRVTGLAQRLPPTPGGRPAMRSTPQLRGHALHARSSSCAACTLPGMRPSLIDSRGGRARRVSGGRHHQNGEPHASPATHHEWFSRDTCRVRTPGKQLRRCRPGAHLYVVCATGT